MNDRPPSVCSMEQDKQNYGWNEPFLPSQVPHSLVHLLLVQVLIQAILLEAQRNRTVEDLYLVFCLTPIFAYFCSQYWGYHKIEHQHCLKCSGFRYTDCFYLLLDKFRPLFLQHQLGAVAGYTYLLHSAQSAWCCVQLIPNAHDSWGYLLVRAQVQIPLGSVVLARLLKPGCWLVYFHAPQAAFSLHYSIPPIGN